MGGDRFLNPDRFLNRTGVLGGVGFRIFSKGRTRSESADAFGGTVTYRGYSVDIPLIFR